MTDWTAYRTCRICNSPPGKACTAMYTRVLEGEHTGPPVALETAHAFRKRVSGR